MSLLEHPEVGGHPEDEAASVVVEWGASHAPDLAGSADRIASPLLGSDPPSVMAEAGGEPNRVVCSLIHRSGRDPAP